MKRNDCKESVNNSQSDEPDRAVGLLKHTGSDTSFRPQAMLANEGDVGTGLLFLPDVSTSLEKMSAALSKQPTPHLEP